MLSKSCPLFLFLFIAFGQTAYSNGRLFPGYYIDNKGDSIPCKIEYHDWFRNPSSIVIEENGVRKTLRPTVIKGFGVTGYEDYQSANVTYHPGPVRGYELPLEFSDATTTKDCFLLILVKGPYSLYELKLAERECFFLTENGGPIEELVYRVKQSQMRIYTDDKYKITLGNYLVQEHLWDDQDPSAINDLTYTKKKIMALVVELNAARTGVTAPPPPTPARHGEGTVQLEIFGGGVFNLFPSSSSGEFGTAQFPATFSAAGGLGLHVVIPGHFNAFSAGLTLGYSTFQSSTSMAGTTKVNVRSDTWYTLATYRENPALSNSLLTTSLYFMYALPRAGKIRPYVRLGVNLEFLLKSERDIHSNWSADFTDYHSTNPPYDEGTRSGTYSAGLRNSVVCANIGIGVQMDRHRIELAYYTPMQLAVLNQPTFNLERLAVYYYFTVLR